MFSLIVGLFIVGSFNYLTVLKGNFITPGHYSFNGVKEVTLEVLDLKVEVAGKEILKGVSLRVDRGSIHAVMGPNGSGKSTLAYTIMGRPSYKVVSGDIRLDGESILDLPPEERSLKGIFLAFQEPIPIPGVKIGTFIIAALNKRAGSTDLTRISNPFIVKKLYDALERVGLSREYLTRELYVGFSGGEKKRGELFQALLLDPKVIILDEPDSGLDVDGVKMVAKMIEELKSRGKAVLLITHYARIFNYIQPDQVTVLVNGRVAARGGLELVHRIEREGYGFLNHKAGGGG